MSTIADVLDVPQSGSVRTITWKTTWWLPLALILVVQAILSARLATYFPSSDEGRYIYSGHQLIYEFWHGGGSPYYETYFSGAPDVYPPIAAVIDHVGGLVAVRLANAVFMLGATSLLFLTARRIFGYGPALASAGLFAGLGLTHALGAFANYDAMTVLLLAFASYCAVRAGEPGASGRWIILVPAGILAANSTKYSSLVFDPAVIALAAFQFRGWMNTAVRAGVLVAATFSLILLAAYLAGSAYVKGAMFTTLDRPKGTNVILSARYTSASTVLAESEKAIGAVVILGALAVLLALASRADRRHAPLLAAMTVAGLLVTAEALRLHSDESMDQHNGFGAWFVCIAAGYALSPDLLRAARNPVRYLCAGVACLAVSMLGVHYANSGRILALVTQSQIRTGLHLASVARPYLDLRGGRYLISGALDEMIYMDHVNIPWFNLADDNYIKYPIPGRGGDSHGQVLGKTCTTLRPGCTYLEGSVAYRAAVRVHYFAFILLGGRSTAIPQDLAIEKAVKTTPGYVQVGNLTMWIYAPAYRRGIR